MNLPLASVLVLSEDSAGDSGDTLAALFQKILLVVDPACQTYRIDFEPLQNAEARRVLRANVWRSSQERDQRGIELLRQSIATKLLEEPAGFVVFHCDGDTPWSARKGSTISALFEAKIRAQVRQLIAHKVAQRGLPAEACDAALSRLFLLVSFYSIESWLYQNTTCALRLCQKHYQGRDSDLFRQWAADRKLLDEVDKPKQKTCLRASHNLELAKEQYPAGDVYGESPSFTEAVGQVMACSELVARLKPF